MPALPAKERIVKQNEFRELVNELRNIAAEYHDHESLRDRIAHCLAARLGHPVPDIVPRTPVLERIDERLAADVLTGTATQEVLLVAKGEILRLMGETDALKRQEPVAEAQWAAGLQEGILEIVALSGYLPKPGDKLYAAPSRKRRACRMSCRLKK